MESILTDTSVAEEGLDIPSCNVVIRFDLCETLIEYIQSCGRARQRESRVFALMRYLTLALSYGGRGQLKSC